MALICSPLKNSFFSKIYFSSSDIVKIMNKFKSGGNCGEKLVVIRHPTRHKAKDNCFHACSGHVWSICLNKHLSFPMGRGKPPSHVHTLWLWVDHFLQRNYCHCLETHLSWASQFLSWEFEFGIERWLMIISPHWALELGLWKTEKLGYI